MSLRVAGVLALIFVLASAGAAAETLAGKVVRVVDGDTVYVLDEEKTEHKIRLSGIDAPEHRQPFGQRSKEYLTELLAGKGAGWYKHDRYGRRVGTVWVASPECSTCPLTLDAGLAQVTVGLAWHFTCYAHEQPKEERERCADAEAEARAKRAGLWSEPAPVAPWEWRRR